MSKKTIQLFLILSSIFVCSQKIGIVSDINSKMGYTFLKGTFKATPVVQKDLDFDFMVFLKDYMKKNNYSFEIKNNFDFSKLEDINLQTSNKKELEYVNQYCEENGIDKLLIIRKNTSYGRSDILGMNDLSYNYGIATLSFSKKRALFFSNFLIFPFTKGNNGFKDVFTTSRLTHKFDNDVYDENHLLKNSSVLDYYLPIFKEKLSEDLQNSLK